MPKLNVLIVDDSAFTRVFLRNILREHPNIGRIHFARDGIEAIEQTVKLSPQVVILDVLMPRMDGIAALKEIMKKKPTPVLLLSALSRKEIDETLKGGLEGGAIGFLQKPQKAKADQNLDAFRSDLLRRVFAAAETNIARLQNLLKVREAMKLSPLSESKTLSPRQKVIVFAASTGGPSALDIIFSQLPRMTPPCLIIQHMPRGFTESFAKRLDSRTLIAVDEAHNKQTLRPSQALVAPGGDRHMEIVSGSIRSVVLKPGPRVNFVIPSADISMISAAKAFRSGTLGVVLTGIGRDGVEGARAIKNAGGRIIVENPSTCLADGMPSAVFDENLADIVIPAEGIPGAIRRLGWL
ncbi:MAG: chemotaxis-specific protein-glutamate methyltransferase CheB [Candidatus Heimdallarchaeota archaeon]